RMKNGDQQNPDLFKKRQLKKHKALATGLFFFMAVVYFICIWLIENHYFLSWIGYVKAFAEAAMVGALADWFAVTALFHHPLGIPIPHTNLIENRKQSIGDNLGGFVVSNFLNTATIRPYIERMQVSNFVSNWLQKEKNIDNLLTEVLWLLKDIVEKIDNRMAVKFLAHKSREMLDDVELNDVLASGVNFILQRGDDARIVNYLAKKLHDYVMENEEVVRKKVKEQSHFLIPGFVDNMIATKLTKGMANYLKEIQNQPEHKIRLDIKEQLHLAVTKIKSDAKWMEELQLIKQSLLTSNKVNEYATSAWSSLKTGIINDMSDDRSGVKRYLKKTLTGMAENLQKDELLRNKIDNWIRYNTYKYTLRNTAKVGELISTTVGNWEGKELSNKLELEVGKDLQYIRINGTLVGGLVGLLIHIITQLLVK
ncbi:MAG: DUF445 domain-containing protein, partial [Niabella sp.]